MALSCRDCEKRKRHLDEKLRRREAYRRTCPGTLKARTHNPVHEKGELCPNVVGERLWKGKNTGVTLEDAQFLAKHEEDRA